MEKIEKLKMKAWVKIHHKTLMKAKLVYSSVIFPNIASASFFFSFPLRALILKINVDMYMIAKQTKEKYIEDLNKMYKNRGLPFLPICIYIISNLKISISLIKRTVTNYSRTYFFQEIFSSLL